MTIPVLRCTIDAADPLNDRPQLLVLGPSLGTTTDLWLPAVTALGRAGVSLRILRFDLPGHGASPLAAESFTVAELADAVVRLVDEAGGGRFHYAGVSLGGAIGIELALRHPERLLSLGIFCSDARIGTESSWAERAEQVRGQGTPSLVAGTPARWFAPDFIAREPGAASAILNALSDTDDASYILCCGALARFDRTAEVSAIAVPTVVVSGEHDPVTTPAELAELAARIPGARYLDIAGASHLAAYERPDEAAAILATLVEKSGAPTSLDDVYARGMVTRRAVLGDAHVDAAQAKITAETREFQEFITRYAWGDIWSRPGLSLRERSIATLASLVTGSHENEIAMHVRAALTNGLSRLEIAEVIMHTALYAGLPAANGALAIARTVFTELDQAELEQQEETDRG
jgi:3-oxoadipate enol-lactonase/4-carboxymuconolactone decarboxylase